MDPFATSIRRTLHLDILDLDIEWAYSVPSGVGCNPWMVTEVDVGWCTLFEGRPSEPCANRIRGCQASANVIDAE